MSGIAKVLVLAVLYGMALPQAMADGLYGALDLGQTNEGDACNNGLVGSCSGTSTAVRGGGGYLVVPRWSAEVSYADYGNASTGGPAGDWQASGLQASGIGTFPVWRDISVIGKVGLARTDYKLSATSRSSTTTNLAVGAGVQYEFRKDIAFRAQYEDLGTVGDANTTGTTKLTLLSAGVIFKF